MNAKGDHQLRLWNKTDPITHTVSMRLESLFESALDSLNIRTKTAVHDCSTGLSLTYSQLHSFSHHLAFQLSRCMIDPNTGISHINRFVMLYLDTGIHISVGYLGILKAGHAIVPVKPGTPIDRIRYMIDDANISLIITQTKFTSKLQRSMSQGLITKIPVLDIEKHLDLSFSEIDLASSNKSDLDPVYCIYTSGSTGLPVIFLVS